MSEDTTEETGPAVEAPTPTLPTIVQALVAVKSDVGAVGKSERNQQQGFQFRGIDAVLNAVSPALIAHGVIVAPVATSADFGTVEVGSRRTPMGHCRVNVTYRFYGPAGDHLDVQVAAESMDSGDKATAKAMSVAYRIALLQALSLPTDEPDPDSQSYERSPASATDHAWMADVEKRIEAVADMPSLAAISNEIEARRRDGGVEDVHYEHLQHVGRRREAELNGVNA